LAISTPFYEIITGIVSGGQVRIPNKKRHAKRILSF